MKNIRVATSILTKTIYAGKINKEGTYFLSDKKVDVTSDVLKAVIDYIGVNNTHTVSSDDQPLFEISVTKIKNDTQN